MDEIVPGMRLAKSLYSVNGTLLLNSGAVLKQEYIEQLKNKGFNALFIGVAPEDIEVPEVVSETVRMEASCALRESMISIQNSGSFNQQRLEKIVDMIIEEILTKKDIIVNVIDLKSINDYTFRHSVNVCILSLMLGRSLLYSQKKMHELGMGALLHDIGKSLIPAEILDKKDALTNEEFEEIKKHARYGYEILVPFESMNLLSKHVAYQHHERVSGTGYPRKLINSDIVEYAKVAAVADCYDAMTSDRPYKVRTSPKEALKELNLPNFKDGFDQKSMRHLVKMIAPYPVGTKVTLTDGQSAIITKINAEAIDRPLVTIISGDNKIPAEGATRLNLLEDETVDIESCEY